MLADIGIYDCTGSSTWELNGDHVITRIFGPETVKTAKENVFQAILDVEIHSDTGSKNKDALLQSYIKKTFEQIILLNKYPKTLVILLIITIN